MQADNRYSGPDQVRDQRSYKWILIDHPVIMEWLPIIGADGYALYSVYMALATLRADAPGLRKLADHVGIGTQTVQLLNRVLEWSELIAITSGDQENSNVYEVLDVPPVTPELLVSIELQVLHDEMMNRSYAAWFKRRVLSALNNWRTFWQRRPVEDRRNGTGPDVDLLHAKGEPAPAATNADLLRAKGNELRLVAIGLAASKAMELVAAHDAAYVAGWLDWIEDKMADDPGYFKRSVAGYLLKVLANGDPVPEPLPAVSEFVCGGCGRPVAHEGQWCDGCSEKYSFIKR